MSSQLLGFGGRTRAAASQAPRTHPWYRQVGSDLRVRNLTALAIKHSPIHREVAKKKLEHVLHGSCAVEKILSNKLVENGRNCRGAAKNMRLLYGY